MIFLDRREVAGFGNKTPFLKLSRAYSGDTAASTPLDYPVGKTTLKLKSKSLVILRIMKVTA